MAKKRNAKSAPPAKHGAKTATRKQAAKKKKKATRATTRSTANEPRKEYKKNFLKQVIARIDFATPLQEFGQEPPKSVTRALRRRFPVPEQRKELRQHVFFGPEVVRESQEVFQWFYRSKDSKKEVYIGKEAAYLQYKKYSAFPAFRKDFLAVVGLLFNEIGNIQVKRLGLRYINNVEFPREAVPTDWNEYLKKKLLSGFHLADDQTKLSRVFNVLEFDYGDMGMRFQYGMPNPDFPATIKRKVFTLDYDAYCGPPLEESEIGPRLDQFHSKINASFEEVITDGLRDVMGVRRG